GKGHRRATAGVTALLLHRLRLGHMEHSRRPGAPEPALAPVCAVLSVRFHSVHVFLALFALDGHKRHHLDAMLSTPYLTTERSPCVIGEDVFPRQYLALGNPLGHKPG